jgi:transcriptional regulator with XRE-family HTH domain
MTLKERLIAERERKGWTQEDLARSAGIRQSFIGALESSNQKTSGYLPEIAYALGVHAMWLKTGKGPQFLGNITEKTHRAAEEYSPGYAPSITALPTWELELLDAARAASDNGRRELIGMAKLIASQQPRDVSALPKAS